MYDHRPEADILHQRDVLDDAAFELGAQHGVAAVFDDHRLAGELLDIGQGLHQHGRFLHRIHHCAHLHHQVL
jgi:hypothetical protein